MQSNMGLHKVSYTTKHFFFKYIGTREFSPNSVSQLGLKCRNIKDQICVALLMLLAGSLGALEHKILIYFIQ